MRKTLIGTGLVLAVGTALMAQSDARKPEWAMNATIIEACSCPMFCSCYFNDHPASHEAGAAAAAHAGHGAHSFCRFNNAYRINRGHAGDVELDGAKFWLAGDLGAEFSDAEMDWAVLHFDPAVTPGQRDAIAKILPHVYPVKWKSFSVGQDYPMEWRTTGTGAVARLDGGKAAEVVLEHAAQASTSGPVVMKNLKYWGVPDNEGFVMMPNEVEAYRLGDKAFEYRGSNGFMITFDVDSTNAAPAPGGM